MGDITYLAASNAASELSGVGKQRSLCSECRKLNLSASKFFLPKGELYEGSFILYTRPWSLIRDATDCSLCQLIVFAVRMASEQRLIREAPWQCQLIFCLQDAWGLTVENDVDRSMAMKFVAMYNWTSVSGFLIPVQSDDYPGAFPGRVFQPGQIDIKQVHRWLQQCKKEHKGTCRDSNATFLNKIGTNILVIDVDAQCLRVLPDSGRYIALSYVWGGVEQVETTMGNLQDFLVPGAFSKVAHGIPKTIRDAMEFVKQLGERFLWVDAFCIIQDDPSTKQQMIDCMNLIYENAYITLFAASGDNSHAGLPGVLPSSRNVDQLMATVADGLTFIYPTPFKEVMKKSPWATRGWTYQEYFCSPRRLIFVAGQLIYRCNTIRWLEDLATEQISPFKASYQLKRDGEDLYWEPPNYPDKSSPFDYTTYVTTYLERYLTHDNDILNAFAGIMNYAKDDGLITLHGLTEQFFGYDMLWKHSRWASRRPGFPSWSWAGWKGTIATKNHGIIPEKIWLQDRFWIHWYVYDEKKANFVLFTSGDRAALDQILSKGDNSLDTSSTARGNYRQGPRASASSDTTAWSSTVAHLLSRLSLKSAGKTLTSRLPRLSLKSAGKTSTPRLPRLSLKSGEEALTPHLPPSPASCIPNLDSSTLLFRTLTAYLTISALNPNGQKPCIPRTDFSLLPSTPSLFLYTTSGIHIGNAWVSAEDTYNEILKNDRQHNDRLAVELIVLSNFDTGDWRTRNENPTTTEYIQELRKAGMSITDLGSQYETRIEYEWLIADVYDRMVKERASGATKDSSVQLPSGFWELLATQASLEIAESGKFPGHTTADLQHTIDTLKVGGKCLHRNRAYTQHLFDAMKEVDRKKSEKKSVGFLQILLIGRLGVPDNNSSAGAKERIGIGEIREDNLALIDGLALRDVLL
ncbi:heterokaryon incompatibility protein-domain-containing protein, partial [Trichoderma sp. SZMC 28011]